MGLFGSLFKIKESNLYYPTDEEIEGLKDKAIRKIKIGIGTDRVSTYQIIKNLSVVNYLLREYRIFLEIVEVQKLVSPDNITMSNVEKYIPASFSKEPEIYFFFSKFGYNNMSIKSCPKSRSTFFSGNISGEKIAYAIQNEFVRIIAGDDSKTYKLENKSFKKIKSESISEFLNKIDREKSRLDYSGNKSQIRKVKLGVLLDRCSEKRFWDIFNPANEEFQKEFGISLVVEGFLNIELPSSWEVEEVFRSNLDRFGNTDGYLMLTGKSWRKGKKGLNGQANGGYGYLWVTSTAIKPSKVLCHELGHLFQASHDYIYESVMYPSTSPMTLWTQRTKETILKNKFRRWDFSKE